MAKHVVHLHDATGNRLCNEDGPAVPAPALLKDTDDVGLLGTLCPACARVAIAPVVQTAHTRCDVDDPNDDHHLLAAIVSLTTTPPDHAAAVMRILCPALEELDRYIERVRGRHD